MLDIRDYPEIIDAVNGILNKKGSVAEVKREINRKDMTVTIMVVEQYRSVIMRTEADT